MESPTSAQWGLRELLREQLTDARELQDRLRERELLGALIEIESLSENWKEVASLHNSRVALIRAIFDEEMRDELVQLNNLIAERDRDLRDVQQKATLEAEAQKNRQRVHLLLLVVASLATSVVFGTVVSLLRRRALLQRLTLQKRIDEVLVDSVADWETTFNTMADPICIVDDQDRITITNTEFKRRFIKDGVDPESFQALMHQRFGVHCSAQTIPEQVTLSRAADGFATSFSASSTDLPLREPGKRRLVILRDVTSEKRFQQEILEKQKTAESASEAKSEFLAIVSHELRTPINAISGSLELLGDTCLEPSQTELIDITKSSSNQLARLVEDLLGYASIESGKLTIARDPFNPRNAVRETLDTFGAKESVALEADFDVEVPECVIGDKTRYRQVLTNLVSNALRHTEHGFVRITLGWETAAQDTPSRLVTSVKDTGSGIPHEDRDRIFLPFEQGQHANVRNHGGAGLGLAICVKLTHVMGGGIQLVNNDQKGTEFRFTISVLPTNPSTAPNEAPPRIDLDGMRVLLVDDEPVNRAIVGRMLRSMGLHVQIADDGLSAIERIEQSELPFDVVFMDLMMPGMSGFETTHRLRESYNAQQLPIVALTGKASEEDREASKVFEMNAFLTKPVSREELRTTLANVRPYAEDA